MRLRSFIFIVTTILAVACSHTDRNRSMVIVILDTMAQEFTSRFPKLPDSAKSDFDGTLLMQLAEDGNHVVKVALNLVCGFIDDATAIAQTHGGGGAGGFYQCSDVFSECLDA